MTIHSAKGLEYPVVIIAGMEDNLFPSSFVETEKELEEERRLFYVAITRAMEHCIITYARTRFRNGQLTFSLPSQFLKDIDDEYVEKQYRNTVSSQPNTYNSPHSNLATQHFTSSNFQPLNTQTSDRKEIECPYPIGSRVLHGVFGAGTVLAAYNENQNDKIEIRFDKVGTKTLLLRFAKLQTL